MSTTEARGTKRTCQNSDCGERFYDLNHDPIVCPLCQSQYVIASAPPTAPKPEPAVAAPAKPAPAAEDDDDDVEIDDATESLEELAEAEEAVADGADDTFLEEEEDSGDVSGIIGPVAEKEET